MASSSHRARSWLLRATTVLSGVALFVLVLAATPAQAAGSRYAVTITGSVTPAAAGAVVQLQRFTAGAFQTVATTRLGSSSGYRFVQTGQSVGAVLYRVAKPAAATSKRDSALRGGCS